ncbi:MAG: ATP-binding protein [Methermicoccaceae archaeon]
MKIAVTGKGGVGKTTFAGTLACLLAMDGRDIIAIDADPDMNLASAMGCETPAPLTKYKELIDERVSLPGGAYNFKPKVDDIIEKFSVLSPSGARLLVMGTLEEGDSGCLCPASAFLKALLRHVLFKESSTLIMDMEAGIEHLGRGTAKGFDVMVIVIENGMRSVQTAERIKSLSTEVGIKRHLAVLNKVRGDTHIVEKALEGLEIPLIGRIPFDETIAMADVEEKPPYLFETDAVKSIAMVKDELIRIFHT